MKPLSERLKDFPTSKFVDWLCLACVDVREVRTPDDAQEEINKIREAVTERLVALEQRAEAAEHERDCHMDIAEHFKARCKELDKRAEAAEEWVKTAERTMDYQAGVITELGVRAEAAEAKLAELEKQAPYGTLINTFLATDPRAIAEARKRGMPTVEVFIRPAPAINLAELVPGEVPKDVYQVIYQECGGFVDSNANAQTIWNDCRAAILRKIEGAE